MISAEKNEDKVYVNQDESLIDFQYSFLLNFLHESLMILITFLLKPCYKGYYRIISERASCHEWRQSVPTIHDGSVMQS